MKSVFFFSRIEDGIVLSPQRQSFFQGCQIPHSAPERHLLQERGRNGLSRATDREREGRSRLTGRVGRGRTLDYKERTPLQERNKVPIFDVVINKLLLSILLSWCKVLLPCIVFEPTLSAFLSFQSRHSTQLSTFFSENCLLVTCRCFSFCTNPLSSAHSPPKYWTPPPLLYHKIDLLP